MISRWIDLRPNEVNRGHAVGAALWALAAAVVGLMGVVLLATPIDAPLPGLGPGRLHTAYVHLLLLGAITPALVAALMGKIIKADERALQGPWPSAALWLWHAGVALGLIGILGGGMGPEPWTAAPLAAKLPLIGASGLWTLVTWRQVGSRSVPLSVAHWFAVPAVTALFALQCVGLLTDLVSGASQATAAALYARGMLTLWAATAGMAAAAVVLPAVAGRPLFGRRTATYGLAAWLLLAGLAAPRDLLPDLAPGWLLLPVEMATVLLVVPAVLLGIALLGTLVGASRPRLNGAAAFLYGGVVAWLAGVLAMAGAVTPSASAVRMTAWDPMLGLWPPMPALVLMAIGASYATLAGPNADLPAVPALRHLLLTIAAGVLVVATAWPLGLAEAAAGPRLWLEPGSGGAYLLTSARLRVPGALTWVVASLVWTANAIAAARRRGTNRVAPVSWPAGTPGAPSPGVLLGSTVLILATGLVVGLFLPLADPAAVAPTPRSSARLIAGPGLRLLGRSTYVADGCVVCHTQRVRAIEADAPYGPPTARGDYATGPALAGQTRLGPDLAWVGDRYLDRRLMLVRLGVHGENGRPGYPWLFGTGADERGVAVADYLAGLQSGAVTR